MKTLKLRPGRERSLLLGHPWVFDGAIASGGADSGETVRIVSADGAFLAWGAFSPHSKIRARVWSFEESQRIDSAFFAAACARAIAHRVRLQIPSDGQRLIHGEADGLPGLIVDRYGDTLVAQFLSSGVQRWQAVLVDALTQATGLSRVYERSDTSSREREGLAAAQGWLRGQGVTELTIQEHGWRFSVDIAKGHKTGFYLDQRDNRQQFAQWVAAHGVRRVLNCHSYSGGFSIAALSGGAEQVVAVDSSAQAHARAQTNLQLNGIDPARVQLLDADVNASLRRWGEQGEVGEPGQPGRQGEPGALFDAVVLDPPKLAPTVAHAERAARAYKDLNRLALRLLRPGGLLLSFSCSAGVGPELFHKIVAGAAVDAGVDGYISAKLGAAADHPTTLRFPQGEYLKGLLVIRK